MSTVSKFQFLFARSPKSVHPSSEVDLKHLTAQVCLLSAQALKVAGLVRPDRTVQFVVHVGWQRMPVFWQHRLNICNSTILVMVVIM